MKIDFDQTINDFDDNPFQEPTKEGGSQNLTLRNVAVEALMLSFRLNLTMSGREGLRRLKLAILIDAAVEPLELSEDDRRIIYDEIVERCSIPVLARASELLGFDEEDD